VGRVAGVERVRERDYRGHGNTGDADALEHLLGRRAEQVGRQTDRGGPRDAAQGVPEGEGQPMHAVDAGKPGRREADAHHPPGEEHRLRSVLGEERLAVPQHRTPVLLQRARAFQQAPAAGAADQVPDVVADDRPRDRDRDDERDVELAVVGEHAARDERRLARHGHAGRLRGGEGEEDEVAQVRGQVDERDRHGSVRSSRG